MAYELKQFSQNQVAALCAETLFEYAVSPFPALLFVSGGSSLDVLNEFTKRAVTANTSLERLTIAFVDERFDQVHSNYTTLLSKFPSILPETVGLGATWIDTRPVKKDQYEMATWFEEQIVKALPRIRNSNGKIITLLGMGKDGHIAGILPHPDEESAFRERFIDTSRLVVGYDATGKNEYTKRFTCTYPGLQLADVLFLYVTGQEKQVMLSKALTDTVPLFVLPVAFVQQTTQPCEIFTDFPILTPQ